MYSKTMWNMLLTYQNTQSGILTFSCICCSQIVLIASNLLQTKEGVNRTPSHVTVSCFTTHNPMSHVTEQSQDLCEEHTSCHVGTGRPVLVGQFDPSFVPTSSFMKWPTPSTEDLAQDNLLQKYQERVDRPSQQNRVIQFCIDAGFLSTLDVGQYLMIKDTGVFWQFTESVACHSTREVGKSKFSLYFFKKNTPTFDPRVEVVSEIFYCNLKV